MKNILLTGGAGYIGSHVTNLLIDNNLINCLTLSNCDVFVFVSLLTNSII